MSLVSAGLGLNLANAALEEWWETKRERFEARQEQGILSSTCSVHGVGTMEAEKHGGF